MADSSDSPIVFTPLEPHREPGYEAVRALIKQWNRGDVYENSRIWRAVEAFGDAMGIPTEIPANGPWDSAWEQGVRDTIRWLHQATDRSSLRTYESGHLIADEITRHVLGEDV